jgi:uncharacterized coiled-coil DUF342 family protein
MTVKQIREMIKEVECERQGLINKFYDYKNHRWKVGFDASNYNYYDDFTKLDNWKKEKNNDVVFYLNFLTSRTYNLYIKLNRERWKSYG